MLMLAGHVFRADKADITKLAQSSTYLNAISNRLAASSPRARFLGMVVGTAISELVDPKDKRMNFKIEEMNDADGLWYRALPAINDNIGSIEDLKPAHASRTQPQVKATKPANSQRRPQSPRTPAKSTSKIISIEEVDDDTDTDAEELPTYAKPDSDPSDEDEDPTLVQRDKPTAPV